MIKCRSRHRNWERIALPPPEFLEKSVKNVPTIKLFLTFCPNFIKIKAFALPHLPPPKKWSLATALRLHHAR